LLGEGVPFLTRSVAIDVIRAETQRAICTLRTVAHLTGGFPEASSPVAVRRIVAAVFDAVGPEVRLRGSRLTTRVKLNDDVSISVDAQSLVSAVTATVLWLSAGLGERRGAGLDVTVASHPPACGTLTISQESVILPSEMLVLANTKELVTCVPMVTQVASAYSLSATKTSVGQTFPLRTWH